MSAVLSALDDSADGQAWALALRAQQYLAGLAKEMPTLAELRSLPAPTSDRDGPSAAWSLFGRNALLNLDPTGVSLAASELRALASAESTFVLWGTAHELWARVLLGESDLGAGLEELSRRAAQEKLAPLVIEAAVLRAEASLNGADLESAAAHSRRASRMARSEGLPQQEYLAHLSLARFRRRSGSPHLASRIVAGLSKVAPRAWWPALSWEGILSGARVQNYVGPALSLQSFFAAAVSGVPEGLTEAAEQLSRSTAGSARALEEATTLIEATAPTLFSRGLAAELEPWRTGTSPELPHGLRAAVNQVKNPHLPVVGHTWVLARPGEPAVRLLHPGVGLLSTLPRVERTQKRHGRVECAAAVLALAGKRGVAVRDFTPAVYGFPYVPSTHDGVLRVLIHRLRDSLGEAGTVDREQERLVLTPLTPFLVPDPRTSPPTGERVLRMVAARPKVTSQEIAAALGISLRAVQNELRALVDLGACAAVKNGPRVEYAVEDTTYSEPTNFQ